MSEMLTQYCQYHTFIEEYSYEFQPKFRCFISCNISIRYELTGMHFQNNRIFPKIFDKEKEQIVYYLGNNILIHPKVSVHSIRTFLSNLVKHYTFS